MKKLLEVLIVSTLSPGLIIFKVINDHFHETFEIGVESESWSWFYIIALSIALWGCFIYLVIYLLSHLRIVWT